MRKLEQKYMKEQGEVEENQLRGTTAPMVIEQ